MMNLARRQFLQFVGATAASSALSQPSSAVDYPNRPVRVIEGFGAGSPPDIVARLFGQWLSERLGPPFIIDTRLGAAGNIATEAVVRAIPDGYTLLICVAANAINATLYDKLNFNFIHDIAPVAGFMHVPLIMEVNPSFPATTVPEFIAYAKANPGKINFASGGIGTPLHVAGELFKMMAGVDMVHVPYRGQGAPMLADLIGGQVQVVFDPMPSSIGHIRAGTLRALAVTTGTRSEALPDIPTVGDFLPRFEASGWLGLGAPRDTPADIIYKLNKEINAALADPKIKGRIFDLGVATLAGSPAEFGKFIAAGKPDHLGPLVSFVS
jgi:tripartite-type tricarboxylate transporter receptor subunit TctC